MKHIKLLPILSASLLIGATAPITTSCNKTSFDGKLTKEEIIKAIDDVTNPSTWNYICDLKAYAFDEQESTLVGEGKFNFANNGIYEWINGYSNDEPTEDEVYVKKYNNEWFTISELLSANKKFSIDEQLGDCPLISSDLSLWMALAVLKDYVPEFDFNSEYKGYYYYGTIAELKILSFIKFNSNKQIDRAYLEVENSSTDKTAMDFKYSNYGSAKVEFPFKDEDIDYPADTVLDYDSEKQYYTNSSKYLNYGCTFKANANLLSPTKIAIYDSDETPHTSELMQNASIYVNGVKSNCTFAFGDEKAEATITGLTLKENDQIQLVWNFDEYISKPGDELKIRIS